jgi:hypothetical protein
MGKAKEMDFLKNVSKCVGTSMEEFLFFYFSSLKHLQSLAKTDRRVQRPSKSSVHSSPVNNSTVSECTHRAQPPESIADPEKHDVKNYSPQ